VIQDLKDEGSSAERKLSSRIRVADFHRPIRKNCLPAVLGVMLNAITGSSSPPPGWWRCFTRGGMGRYRQIYVMGRKLPKDRTRRGWDTRWAIGGDTLGRSRVSTIGLAR